jgi:hypothetical protein
MRRILIALLFCLPLLVQAQSQTNSLQVVLSDDQAASLRAAWRIENFERTNAVPPLAAVAFRDWQEEIAAAALAERAVLVQAPPKVLPKAK